ncbi:MAG: hypothetical protein ACXQTW_03000, partial [Candidatus Methanospirareceae archaeon]
MKSRIYVALILILIVSGSAAAITITTTDICIDSTPLSEYLSDSVAYLSSSVTKLTTIISKLSDIDTKLTSIESKMPNTYQGAAETLDILYKLVCEGYGYTASEIENGLASGSNITFYISNPSSNTCRISIYGIEVVSTGWGEIKLYKNPTVTSSGTTITPVNLNLSSTRPSNVTIGENYAFDLSSSLLIRGSVIPGGEKKDAIGSFSQVGEHLVLMPGDSVGIVYTN